MANTMAAITGAAIRAAASAFRRTRMLINSRYATVIQDVHRPITDRNQPIFTVDWFSKRIDNWNAWLSAFKNKPGLRFLEIGTFEGRATRWLLDNILTHRSSRIYCIDTFEGSMENKERGVDMSLIKQNFYHNIRPYRRRVRVYAKPSQEVIRNNPAVFRPDSFDFIYIDGSHRTCDVLEDAVLAFRILRKDGLMVFDDYEWTRYADSRLTPKLAIDAWMACFEGQYEVIHKQWQLCVRKHDQ